MRHVLAAVLLSAAFAANAQLYRWTDANGRVHITDTPPPAGAKNIHKREGGTGAAPAEGTEPYVLRELQKNFPVTLYSTPGCDACDDARKLLNARGVPFKEVSVGDQKSIEEVKRVSGASSVPVLLVGSTAQSGFEEGRYQRMLDAAGYPKAGILPARKQAEPQAVQPQAEVKPAPPPIEAPRGPYAPRPPAAEKK